VAGDRVLVTGASGFVGSAVARALVGAGYDVRALVRKTSPRTNLDDLEVEIVEGDMRDTGSLEAAMCGARYLFHVAADYRLWAIDRQEILRTNRDGTRNVMRAALKAGIDRIVYTSSVATLGGAPAGSSADETMRLGESCAIGTYKRSKIAAEHVVEDMIRAEGLPAIIVHPSTPIGPRDVKPTPTGRIIIEAACGRMPCYVDTGLNLVHVDDVAEGHLAALRIGAPGDHYILGGQNVPFAAMLGDIAALTGRRPPWVRLPRHLVYPFAFAAEARAWMTRREPFVTIDGLRMSRHKMFFSSAKAERDLGYRPRPYVEALAEALTWFRAKGLVR
jgi:dihydroflavonol-4-reductase